MELGRIQVSGALRRAPGARNRRWAGLRSGTTVRTAGEVSDAGRIRAGRAWAAEALHWRRSLSQVADRREIVNGPPLVGRPDRLMKRPMLGPAARSGRAGRTAAGRRRFRCHDRSRSEPGRSRGAVGRERCNSSFRRSTGRESIDGSAAPLTARCCSDQLAAGGGPRPALRSRPTRAPRAATDHNGHRHLGGQPTRNSRPALSSGEGAWVTIPAHRRSPNARRRGPTRRQRSTSPAHGRAAGGTRPPRALEPTA